MRRDRPDACQYFGRDRGEADSSSTASSRTPRSPDVTDRAGDGARHRGSRAAGEVNEQVKPMQEARQIAASRESGSPRSAGTCGEPAEDKPRRSSTARPARTLSTTGGRSRQRGGGGAARHVQPCCRPPDDADDPGRCLPKPVVGPVINFIDAARPMVSALGPRQPAIEDVVEAEGDAAHRRADAVG